MKLSAKTIAFVLMMAVLGNVLFAISSPLIPFSPGITLDLSLIAVFIAGYYGGPSIGFITGLFAGILPGIMYGPMGSSSWLGLFGLPFGKALTGLTTGAISKWLRLGHRQYSSILTIPSTVLAYVPEGIFTYAYFVALMPLFLSYGIPLVFVYGILLKAVGEVVLMSFLMAALIGNHGFSDFVSKFFARPYAIPAIKAKQAKLEA